jgi:hypothetical protein
MKKQTFILILSTLTLLSGCKVSSNGSSSTSAASVLSKEEGTAKLQKALSEVPSTKAVGVTMSNLACDFTAYSTPEATSTTSSSASASTSSSSNDLVEIASFQATGGTIKAAVSGLDATKAADLKGQASLAFDEIDYGVNLLDVKDSYKAKTVNANVYLANGNGYLDLESSNAIQLAMRWMSDVLAIINNLPKGNSTSALFSPLGPAFADSTSESFTPLKVGKTGLLSDDSFPLWSSSNTEKYTNYLGDTSSFILTNNEVFSFSYDASGNAVMAASFTKASLKALLAEIVSEDQTSSSLASSSSIDLTQYNQAIDALALNDLSGKVTFSDSAILGASWSVDLALPENSAVAGKGSLKMSGEASFSYGADVSVTLPNDLSSYQLLP